MRMIIFSATCPTTSLPLTACIVIWHMHPRHSTTDVGPNYRAFNVYLFLGSDQTGFYKCVRHAHRQPPFPRAKHDGRLLFVRHVPTPSIVPRRLSTTTRIHAVHEFSPPSRVVMWVCHKVVFTTVNTTTCLITAIQVLICYDGYIEHHTITIVWLGC